jgi:hypothetical protein
MNFGIDGGCRVPIKSGGMLRSKTLSYKKPGLIGPGLALCR